MQSFTIKWLILCLDLKLISETRSVRSSDKRIAATPSYIIDQCFLENKDHVIVGDVFNGRFCPLDLQTFYDLMFQKFHFLSHGGANAISKLIGESYVFLVCVLTLKKSAGLALHVKNKKLQGTKKAPLKSYQKSSRIFQVWHVDLSEPMPNSNSCCYLFACTDRYTCWMEAVGVPDATTATCARAFVTNIIARFGVPSQIVCDNGPAFTAQLF